MHCPQRIPGNTGFICRWSGLCPHQRNWENHHWNCRLPQCPTPEDLLELPWTYQVTNTSDGYLIRVKELYGCFDGSPTLQGAINNLQKDMLYWFAMMLSNNSNIPFPEQFQVKEN